MDIPEKSISEILESNPSQGTLYVLLKVMRENGRINLVIKECMRAVSRFPEDLILKKILAEAYMDDGRFTEAEAEFDKVIKGMESLAGALKSQADIYIHQKREEEAVASLKKYLAVFPENEDASDLLDKLVPAVDAPEEVIPEELPEAVFEPVEVAEELFEPAVTETLAEDEYPEIITASLAEAYFRQGEYDEARDIYERLVEKDPEDISSISKLEEISALTEIKAEPETTAAEEEPLSAESTEDVVRGKKEKVISILDNWRSNIRALSGEGAAT